MASQAGLAQNIQRTIQNKEIRPLFSEHFSFQPHALINFVGGGGKTALIHKLLEEYCSQGPALYTTTTRIHPPESKEGLTVISSENLTLLRSMIEHVARSYPDRPYKLTATRGYMSPDLLRGVPADFLSTVERKWFSILLNEADGAASFSIKLPREGEPVLMSNAEYLVPVIGLDCIYQPMGPKVVFRFQNLAHFFHLQEGDLLTPELAAFILMHPRGVCKDWTADTTIIPFINKVDRPEQDSEARYLALQILRNCNFPVKKVVFGSVLKQRVDSISIEQFT